MEKWVRPHDYMGPDYNGYYIIACRNRDSTLLEESNFQVIMERLAVSDYDGSDPEQDGNPSPINVRHRHFAYGWVEFIFVHESDSEHMDEAQEIEDQLSQYPILDEDRYIQMEYERITETWKSLPLSERIELCAKNEISIFAARRNYPPANNGRLDSYLSGE